MQYTTHPTDSWYFSPHELHLTYLLALSRAYCLIEKCQILCRANECQHSPYISAYGEHLCALPDFGTVQATFGVTEPSTRPPICSIISMLLLVMHFPIDAPFAEALH